MTGAEIAASAATLAITGGLIRFAVYSAQWDDTPRPEPWVVRKFGQDWLAWVVCVPLALLIGWGIILNWQTVLAVVVLVAAVVAVLAAVVWCLSLVDEQIMKTAFTVLFTVWLLWCFGVIH